MTQFPKPIPLPDQVSIERVKRAKQLLWAARLGIFIRVAIILCEFAGVLLFGSAALLMDALSSSLDIVTSLLLMLFIRLAHRPPDENHPFGHGRYEPLAGLLIGILMIVVGLGMGSLQLFEISQPDDKSSIVPFLWIIPFAAMILLEISYQVMVRVAKRRHSPALAADAVHYRIDGLTSLFAAVALFIGSYMPDWSTEIDYMGAFFISVLMIVIGSFAVRNNLHQLMDHVPDADFFHRVRKAASRVDGVLGTEKIRIQLYGPDAHVDIDVEVDPKLPVDAAHCISQFVRAEIQKDWPQVRDVTVHIEPYYPEDH